MDVLSTTVLAVRALRSNVLRSTLTIGGLAIGVAAVIIVTGISSGARGFIEARINALGTNMLLIVPKPVAASSRRGSAVRLTESDVRALARDIAAIEEAAPIVTTKVVVARGDISINAMLVGTNSVFFRVKNWPVERGDRWTPSDEHAKSRVCVLGSAVARRLFANEDPVGRTIRIGSYPFRVVGQLQTKGQDITGVDQDDRILLPIGSLRGRLAPGPPGYVTSIAASTQSPRAATRAVSQVEALLQQRHHRTEPDVSVVSQKNLLDIQNLVLNALTGFLVCVAGVSLIVGGIGVMNIMLVSVTERTREIGIRMAVGASRADVLTQFVAEAAMLAMIGGLVGVVLGLVVVKLLSSVVGWTMTVGATAVIAGLVVSGSAGVVFGFAPARRASLLNPTEALRNE